MNWASYQDGLSNLFDKGGLTLWAILTASILLWILIIERYWAHWRQLPAIRKRLHDEFLTQRDVLMGMFELRRIESLVRDFKAEADKNIGALNALTRFFLCSACSVPFPE